MSMTKKLLLISVLLALLASCAATQGKPRVVIMQNPESMDFQNCKVEEWWNDQAFKDNEECVKGYLKQGYIVWGTR